jgi:hypothetical protein
MGPGVTLNVEMEIIAEPMHEVFPEKSKEEIILITHMVYSSVHGIVLLGVGRRLSSGTVEELSDMIKFLISQLGDVT